MKVLLVNDSPHQHGCTDAALNEITNILNAEGIERNPSGLGISRSLDVLAVVAAKQERSPLAPQKSRPFMNGRLCSYIDYIEPKRGESSACQ